MNTEPLKSIGIVPPHPGSFILQEIVEPLNLSIAQAADALGVKKAKLSDLVHEKASLSPEMALRIEKAFGVSMDTLLRMQAWFDACAMRARSDEVAVTRFDPSAPGRA